MTESRPKHRLSVETVALLLVLLAATARLLLQILSMPPYAGLDELYHVGRVLFVAHEGRQPTTREPSMPMQLARAGGGSPDVPPSFSTLGPRWPSFVPPKRQDWPNPAVERAGYHGVNYEAQQPSLWYAIAARVASLSGTMLGQLFALRLFSVVCALLVVIVAMRLGSPMAAALLVCLPSWLVLVARASNDALACALIAVAVMAPAWQWVAIPLGLAVKGYVAPLLALAPFRLRHGQTAILAAIVAVAALLVTNDLVERAGNAFGLQSFGMATPAAQSAVKIDYVTCAKAFVASFAWPGGPHGNALRPAAIVMFLLPLLLLGAWAFIRADRRTRLQVGVAVLAFLGAQAVHFAGFLLKAIREGRALPQGGFEGWYVYALAPVVIGLLAARLPWRAVVGAAIWLLLWDVLLHEGGIFRDYAGLTAPGGGSPLFRWSGALFSLTDYGRGGLYPGIHWSVPAMLRVVHVAATACLVISCWTAGKAEESPS